MLWKHRDMRIARYAETDSAKRVLCSRRQCRVCPLLAVRFLLVRHVSIDRFGSQGRQERTLADRRTIRVSGLCP